MLSVCEVMDRVARKVNTAASLGGNGGEETAGGVQSVPIPADMDEKIRLAFEEKRTRLGLLLREKNPVLFDRWAILVGNTVLEKKIASYSLLSTHATRKAEFASLFRQAALNSLKWVQRNDEDPVAAGVTVAESTPDQLDMYFGDIKIGGRICGYDFLLGNEPAMPCMSLSGGFPSRYSHVLPALMLANFLAVNKGKVDTTVICMGFQYSSDERWWKNEGCVSSDTVAQWVVESEVFQTFKDLTCTETVRRICIWLVKKGHVFMVVWERGSKFDVIYFTDSTNTNPFRTTFLNDFAARIDCYRPTVESGILRMNRFQKSLLSCSDVECDAEFACVSFMARCTVYLNTMDLFIDAQRHTTCILHHADVEFSKKIYNQFENALFACLSENILGDGTETPKCVWFSDAMNKRFVNIRDVHLIVFDPESGEPDTAMRMQFTDANNPFKAKLVDSEEMVLKSEDAGIIINPKGKACSVQSKFNQPLSNYQSFHLLSALSVIQECKDLLSSASSTIRCLDSISI